MYKGRCTVEFGLKANDENVHSNGLFVEQVTNPSNEPPHIQHSEELRKRADGERECGTSKSHTGKRVSTSLPSKPRPTSSQQSTIVSMDGMTIEVSSTDLLKSLQPLRRSEYRKAPDYDQESDYSMDEYDPRVVYARDLAVN